MMPSSTTARLSTAAGAVRALRRGSFLGCTFDRCAWSDVVFSFCQMSDAWLLHCAFRSIAWGGLQGRSALVQPFGRAEQCEFRYNEFSGMALKQFDFVNVPLATACLSIANWRARISAAWS